VTIDCSCKVLFLYRQSDDGILKAETCSWLYTTKRKHFQGIKFLVLWFVIDFFLLSNIILFCVNVWFITCKLALNLDKMNIVKFIVNNSVQYSRSVDYDGKHIEESVNTKFLY
jgi:hypothetical protein